MTSTDLFGKPLGGHREFKLSLTQKRQATLLYHWMSLDYLKDLKALLDALIDGVNVDLALAKAQGRDQVLTNERWGVRDTAANWSTYAHPALEDFRQSTIWHLAARANQEYGKTGADQCSRMLSEHSSLWMSPDEEERFKKQFDLVYHHAQFIDFAAGAGGQRTQLNDHTMVLYWAEFQHLFARLPKFRVRTDIEGSSGDLPVRTGVYVAQDDPYATLQFAWTGNEDGILGNAMTLNDIGRRVAAAVGRESLWVDGQKMANYAVDAFKRGELTNYAWYKPGDESDPDKAPWIIRKSSMTSRPCKWYFVEMIHGELDDEAGTSSVTDDKTSVERLRCESGHPCPREGYWFTPAQAGSRRHFKAGEVMPEVGGDYGATIWQWDENQQ